MSYFRLFSRDHRGSLSDSLLTRKVLTIEQFNFLLPNYEFYAYDERINSFMFILCDLEHKWKDFPCWLEINLLRSDKK